MTYVKLMTLILTLNSVLAMAEEKGDTFIRDISTALASQGIHAQNIKTSVNEDTLSSALAGTLVMGLLNKGNYDVRNITFNSGPLLFKCWASVTNNNQTRQVMIRMCSATSSKTETDLLIPFTVLR